MAGEGGDQVGVFDLPIDVAGEGSTSKVAAGDFVQRMLYSFLVTQQAVPEARK